MSMRLAFDDGALLVRDATEVVPDVDCENRVGTYRVQDVYGDYRWPPEHGLWWGHTFVHENHATGAVVRPVPTTTRPSNTRGEGLTVT